MAERAPAKTMSLWRDDDGSALVEATIVMPLLISFFLGVFEFSWFLYNQQLVVSGLRDAARYMTRIELTDGNRDPCAQKDQNGVLYTADAANIATTAQSAAGGSARVSGWNAADVTISCYSSAALNDGRYADGSTSMTIIDVATRFADPSLGLFSTVGLKAPLLTFSHEERSTVHSAHVGQEVEVHYRWHPLYGRRVRQHYSELRAGGRVAHVEAAPGVVVVLAAWMLDAAACTGMKLGAPHLDVAALSDLRDLLIDRGFRRSSLGDSRIAQEEQNAQFAEADFDNAGAVPGAAPAQNRVRFPSTREDECHRADESHRLPGQPLDAGGRRRDGGAKR